MIAPALLDPFETEVTLTKEPRVLRFSAKAFEIGMEELLRRLSFDTVGKIPRRLGEAAEEDAGNGSGPWRYRLGFFQVGDPVLAITSEIEGRDATHRVLEMLGVPGDARVRLNLVRPHLGAGAVSNGAGPVTPDGAGPGTGTGEDAGGLALPTPAREAIQRGQALGMVRIWAATTSTQSRIRRTLTQQLQQAGLEPQTLGREVSEPVYRPPAADRVVLDALPENDLKVVDILVQLLNELPVENGGKRAARRVGAAAERERGSNSIVSYRYEIHRAVTGVIHVRRREVEAGVERPGLVRTFNVAGLRGLGRLRIRDVGGRASAEFAGSKTTVATIREVLRRRAGARI